MMQPRSYSAVMVDWIPGLQYTIGVALETYAAGDQTAGLSQADAVQLVTGLSVLRSICSMPVGKGLFAEYNNDAAFIGERVMTSADVEAAYRAGNPTLAIVGDNPIAKLPAGAGLPADWSRRLTLACDQAIVLVREAREGPDVVGTVVATPALALPAVPVIVAGVAVAVIAATAAWRYLDPEARVQIAAVEKAAEAYQLRLETYQTTGTMPPASEVEKASASAVDKLAGERNQNRWMWGAAAVGGGALLVSGAALLRRATA